MSNLFNTRTEELFKAILTLESVSECEKFFADACTIKEIQEIAQRYEVAQMLNNGTVYSEIAKKTGASTATISRVNKCLNYGEGGYKLVLSKTDGGKAQ